MALSGKSLDAATSIGAGASIVPDRPAKLASMSIVTTGSPTIDASLEGTIDGTIWHTINSVSAMGGSEAFIDGSGNNLVFTAYRANLTSLSGGSSPTVSASIAIFS